LRSNPSAQAPALIVFEWATQIDRARATAALDSACAADAATAGPVRQFGGAVSEEGLWACCLVYVSCAGAMLRLRALWLRAHPSRATDRVRTLVRPPARSLGCSSARILRRALPRIVAAYRLARFNVGALTVVPAAQPRVDPDASQPPASQNGTEEPSAAPPTPQRAHPSRRDELAFSAPRVDLGGSQAEGTEAFSTTYVSRAKFFRGVPAPQGALMVVAPVVLALRHAADRSGHGGGRPRAEAWTETWPFPPWLSAQTLASVWLLLVGCLMVLTWPMLSSKMAMRDPATESHIRSRSALTLTGKVVAGATVAWVLISVRSWSYIALTLCAAVEVALALSVPLGPIVYHFAIGR
jgi:hypothetical protein